MYQVLVGKHAMKQALRMPELIQKKLANLVEDLGRVGPVQAKWPNYSRLSTNKYHCHLSHKWIACWYHKKGTVRIEVYYAGSRENAPY